MSAEAFPSSQVHPSEDLLEEYSFGRVAEPLVSQLEEHLLICVRCQEQLRNLDNYIAAMKKGTAEMETRERVASLPVDAGTTTAGAWYLKFPAPTVAWVAAAVVLIIALLGFLRTAPNSRISTPAVVVLTALRGTPEDGSANAPSGRPLSLTIDARVLAESSEPMSLEIVNESGTEVWKGPASGQSAGSKDGSVVTASMTDGLRPGRYWARLYTGNTLLREFGIRVR